MALVTSDASPQHAQSAGNFRPLAAPSTRTIMLPPSPDATRSRRGRVRVGRGARARVDPLVRASRAPARAPARAAEPEPALARHTRLVPHDVRALDGAPALRLQAAGDLLGPRGHARDLRA